MGHPKHHLRSNEQVPLTLTQKTQLQNLNEKTNIKQKDTYIDYAHIYKCEKCNDCQYSHDFKREPSPKEDKPP